LLEKPGDLSEKNPIEAEMISGVLVYITNVNVSYYMNTPDVGLILIRVLGKKHSLRLVAPKYHNSFFETFPTSGIFEQNTIIKLHSLSSNECKRTLLMYGGKLKGRGDGKQRRNHST